MASDFIGIEVQGLEELRREFGNWPNIIQDEVINSANQYVLKGVKTYPPYRYVPFKSAYGGWFSEKQRRYVMARISEGSITPGRSNRTNRLKNGWQIIGEGKNSMVVNQVPYAAYVMGDGEQARMPAKIGWKTIGGWVKSNMSGIVNAARQGLVEALKRINK